MRLSKSAVSSIVRRLRVAPGLLWLCACFAAGGGVSGSTRGSSTGDGTTDAAGASSGTSAGTGAGNGNSTTGAGPAATASEGDGNTTIGPTYTADPNMSAKAGVAAGRSCQFVMSGDSSAYYTGNDNLLTKSYAPIQRNVYVTVPAQYKAGQAAPFLILHDAQYTRPYVSNVLANLADSNALPPMVSIALDNGGGDSFGSERGLEYDIVSEKYATFVNNEVLPAVEANCQVTLTKDAAGRGVLGLSSGGAAAIGMGYWHPEWFGRIITYSATMIAQFPTKDYPQGAWAYPTQLFPSAPAKNLRIFLCAGQNDLQAGNNDDHDFLLANRKAADALAAKGYHYQFVYALGASHTDDRVVRQTLPQALVWAWRGYVAP